MLKALVQHLLLTNSQMPDAAMLYEQKPGGFQCSTCRYSRRIEDDQGACAIKGGPISLSTGCCIAWTADPQILMAVNT